MSNLQQVYITKERVKKLRQEKSIIGKVEKLCKCKIALADDDIVEIEGDAFSEFNAKNIIFAFGRGFDIDIACRLADADYYFNSIDLEQVLNNEKRIKQVKARVIGEAGKTKRYIEEVSNARISVYGNTISLIGTINEIGEAETAVNTIVEGGTHRLAYMKMEATHRKNKAAKHAAGF